MTATATTLTLVPIAWGLDQYCSNCQSNHRSGGTGYCNCDCHRTADAGWENLKACHGDDLSLFIGPDGETIAERNAREAVAKEICGWCPVTAQCLRFAARTRAHYGVFGNTGQAERARMRIDAYQRARALEAAA